MTTKLPGMLALVLFFLSCGTAPRQQEETGEYETPLRESFMHNINKYCGNTLSGEVFADHSRPELTGATVAFSFEKCTEKEVRINTLLPGDEKVVIILTLINDELLLKHDVRDARLSPGQYTMYGGFSDDSGNNLKQVFPVHNFGGEMWPGYENYAWEICIDKQEGTFEYIEMAENIIQKHYKATLPEL